MKRLLNNITAYMQYLQTQGYSVTMHFKPDTLNKLPKQAFLTLINANIHRNPYCIRIKSENSETCMRCQQRVIQKCQAGTALIGTCHAGVKEYIFPIYHGGGIIGYVAASGYKGKAYRAKFPALWNESLQDEFPVSQLASLIPPLARMLELLWNTPLLENIADDEYYLICQYISNHYHTVTLEDLCRHFSRSRTHISRLFNENAGITLRAYCNRLKLEDAIQLLRNTDMQITEIAYETGFSDSSYFIKLFREYTGKTPYRMRKEEKNHDT